MAPSCPYFPNGHYITTQYVGFLRFATLCINSTSQTATLFKSSFLHFKVLVMMCSYSYIAAAVHIHIILIFCNWSCGHFATGLCFKQTGCIRSVQNKPDAKIPKPVRHFATGLGSTRIWIGCKLFSRTNRNTVCIQSNVRNGLTTYRPLKCDGQGFCGILVLNLRII